MQEEVTGKTVTLIVNGAKMSEQVFEKAVKKFLEEIQKSRQPKIYRGKQTLKQLASQNAGLANIEISDKNIKAFTHVAKKYHVDFALKKDTAAEQPRYLVFSRAGTRTPSRRPSRVCRPQDGPGGKTRHPGPAGAGEGTGGAETGAPDTGPGESQNQGSERAAMNMKN